MDINDLIEEWVTKELGSHFRYAPLGGFYYIRCDCPEYSCAIVRVEERSLHLIDPIRSIQDIDDCLDYSKKDDIISVKIANPDSFDIIKPMILDTHEVGKKAWGKRKKNLDGQLR